MKGKNVLFDGGGASLPERLDLELVISSRQPMHSSNCAGRRRYSPRCVFKTECDQAESCHAIWRQIGRPRRTLKLLVHRHVVVPFRAAVTLEDDPDSV